MSRFRLTLEYDGALFHGWQIQPTDETVQGVLESALARLFNGKLTVIGAGRTDSGVHATAQVAHFDTPRDRPTREIVRALNALTPPGLTILAAEKVENTFHARYSAYYREYCYKLFIRAEPPALERGRVWHHPRPLDVSAMRAGAEYLLGTHDFSAFRAASCSAPNPVRTLSLLQLDQEGPLLLVRVGANAFLYHMVRNLVGSLVKVGLGDWQPDRIQAVLQSLDRQQAGPMAPAVGLYLTRVSYPEADQVF
ncbi:MAG: tRNA pseudouridine(38-40) synthase TruA [Magnetococcales bacterium]|nr:tRNA pseudouridine(38-40) synthase TruA [Magnetococcales bacterium]